MCRWKCVRLLERVPENCWRRNQETNRDIDENDTITPVIYAVLYKRSTLS